MVARTVLIRFDRIPFLVERVTLAPELNDCVIDLSSVSDIETKPFVQLRLENARPVIIPLCRNATLSA